MNILCVNIGSTSFKFRLFEMDTERARIRGGVDHLGTTRAHVYLHRDGTTLVDETTPVADQAEAVRWCMQALAHGGPDRQPLRCDAVGFKAVHGGPIDRPVRVDEDVLAVMESYAAVCPAHNPAYIAAMRAFRTQRPELPLVAAFETGFHQTIPASRTTFGIPFTWTRDFGIRRYGFHGASHAYVAEHTAALLGRDDLKVISCHLGGSSSVCALNGRVSVANSFGVATQSGLPHNNRVGDFDPYALPLLSRRTGEPIDKLLEEMATRGGLLGISGTSSDMRAILQSAEAGDAQAALARDVYVESVRHYIGAYLVALRGLDVLVFTGGIGERSPEIRTRVCAGLACLGITLNKKRNAVPTEDGTVSTARARVRVLALETNEELVVARHTLRLLHGDAARRSPANNPTATPRE